MAKEDKTQRIYTGSVVLVQALVARLEEQDIFPIVRDDQQNAVMFGSGSNFSGQLRIFVSADELPLATSIVTEFKRELEDNS